MKRYNNNARKRRHVPKVSRYWKPIVSLRVTDEELTEAFESTESFNGMISRITADLYDRMEAEFERYYMR